MNGTLVKPTATDLDRSVIATYRNHATAEAAVHNLISDGVPLSDISIIGRNFETFEDVQGFYRTSDAAIQGAGAGACFGGIFGMMWGAMALLVVPVLGPFVVLGPLAGLIAGAIGGAGIGAVANSLVASGATKEQAIQYQERLKAGEFLILVRGSESDVAKAHQTLDGSEHAMLQKHGNGH